MLRLPGRKSPAPTGVRGTVPAMQVSREQLAVIALHESGHAVVALLLGAPVRFLSLVPRPRFGDIAHVDRPWTGDLKRELVIALAGLAAEALADGGRYRTLARAAAEYPDGADGDLALATNECRATPQGATGALEGGASTAPTRLAGRTSLGR